MRDVFIGTGLVGSGVLAARAFTTGDVILRIGGTPLTFAEAHNDREVAFNMLQVAPRLYLRLDTPAVFINHSCEPNAGIADDLLLVALRDIASGDEVLYDYSTTMSGDLDSMSCVCGATSCRGEIGNFEHLPLATQRRYRHLGIVQSFILRRLDVPEHSELTTHLQRAT
jgi:uncharacterized protein